MNGFLRRLVGRVLSISRYQSQNGVSNVVRLRGSDPSHGWTGWRSGPGSDVARADARQGMAPVVADARLHAADASTIAAGSRGPARADGANQLPSLEVTVIAHEVRSDGGMERQLTMLIGGLLREGWRVTLVSRVCALPTQAGLRWIKVPCPRRPFAIAFPWFFLVASLLVWRHGHGIRHSTGAIVLNRVDVATVHLCHHGLARVGPLQRASRPSLAYRLNQPVSRIMSRLGERWCYRGGRARRLVGVSEGVARELREHFGSTGAAVGVIPNGVDPSVFRPDPGARSELRRALALGSGDLVALFVGGDWELKGLRMVIEAVARSAGWHLVVVGRGDAHRYGELARRMGAGDRVKLVGPAAQTAPYFAMADAFVLPSVYETFSLVTYEAAAVGLPLLATRVSGVEDLIQDGVNGWFVERDPASIAARLAMLGDDSRLRATMGAESRRAAAAFSWEHVIATYSQLFRELVQGASGGPGMAD